MTKSVKPADTPQTGTDAGNGHELDGRQTGPASGPPPAIAVGDRSVALITGASSGVGHATARRFAARGWRVFATMRRPEKGEALRAEALDRGWALETPQLDVTDDVSVARAVGGILSATRGRIDLLMNNAAYYSFGPLEETTPDELRAQMETNLIGVHRVTRAVVPAMRARKQGRIVVMSSVSGLVVMPAVGAYHASKWAIEAWAEALRYELGPLGIAVVLIEPGPFKTSLHDNEVWAAAAGAPGSPYVGMLSAYKNEFKKLRRGELPVLVDVIERAATMRRPRLRWPVGPKAFSGAYLRRICPDWIYERVMRFVFRDRAP